MTAEAPKFDLGELIQEVGDRLDEAVRIVRSAGVFADAGNQARAIEVIRDAEQPIYEAHVFLTGARLIDLINEA